MTARHPLLTVVAACTLLAAQAGAQPDAVQPGPAAASELPLPAGQRSAAALVASASADAKSPMAKRGMSTTTVTAAGSVLVLADGIVAHARTAQVLPPAPGFQYEP